ncbi:uncharacterized protein LOC110985680 [Acanthaster planci]|uniref:Uncharacterized protein LOC110985680 n=1 Tax=Acanthaster planci TaxID=133434 RepID=A0A8B7ZC59_ACAPL|nr:uncharacterized protein LOC110985680 [Acanthaster planci]
MNFLAPLPSALYVRYDYQRVVLIGVLLAFTGLIATSFANYLWVVYITYGLLFGAGSNFMITVAINLVTSHYPGESNVRATSLTSAGQPVGLLILSASLNQACFYLGWRNGLRIVSGLTLATGLLCTALLRPPSATDAHDNDIDCKPATGCRDTGAEAGCSSAESAVNGHATRLVDKTVDFKLVTKGGRGEKAYQPIPSHVGDEFDHSNRESSKSSFSPSQPSIDLGRVDRSCRLSNKVKNELNPSSSLDKPDNQQVGPLPQQQQQTQTGDFVGKIDVSAGTFVPYTLHETSDALLPRLETVPVNKKGATNNPNRADPSFCLRYVRLLRLPGHWLFFPAIITSTSAVLFSVIHFVSFASTVGISEHKASALVIVLSGMELASRMLVFFVYGNRGISKDLTGSFTITLHITAVLFLLAAILFVSTHVWRKRHPLIGQRELVDSDVNAYTQRRRGKISGPTRKRVLPTREAMTPLGMSLLTGWKMLLTHIFYLHFIPSGMLETPVRKVQDRGSPVHVTCIPRCTKL